MSKKSCDWFPDDWDVIWLSMLITAAGFPLAARQIR